MITSVLKFQSAMELMAISIASAHRIFLFFFTVIALCAIIGNVTFYGKFAADQGQTLDTFLESFVNIFIFMTSAVRDEANIQLCECVGFRIITSRLSIKATEKPDGVPSFGYHFLCSGSLS